MCDSEYWVVPRLTDSAKLFGFPAVVTEFSLAVTDKSVSLEIRWRKSPQKPSQGEVTSAVKGSLFI